MAPVVGVGSSPVTASAVDDAVHDVVPAGAPCRNCGAVADRRFCPACGQTTALHPPSVREFVHEFIGHYVALEGPLFATLAALLFTPGRLTVDYFRGRRQRYIPPLRLYLTVSLILFAVAGLNGGVRFGNGDSTLEFGAPADGSSTPTPGDRMLTAHVGPKTGEADSFFERWVARIGAMTPNERNDRVRERMRHDLPYVRIVLVPALALLFKLAYWRRGRLYGDHLVVAFHAQTVAFLFALLSTVPIGGWTGSAISLLLVVHGAIGLRRVYGGRWLPTIVRELSILAAYSVLVVGSVVTIAFIALLR